MKWICDDSYIAKTKGKARKIEGGGDKPLPWWFWIDFSRPIIKTILWNLAVMFGVSEARAKAGYKIGFIAGGHAYIGDEVLHCSSAITSIRRQDWTFFAVDLDGEVIPDEGGTNNAEMEFWVDVEPDYWASSYIDCRAIVD
jgi:hypothetical protein